MDQIFILAIPAFIAGVLTFLAPCTLPLVPGYLSFISGVSAGDLDDVQLMQNVRGRIFLNGVGFVIGFSLIFITLGLLAGLGGSFLLQYRLWLARLGGILVIVFGLFMLGIINIGFLQAERRVRFASWFKPGNPWNVGLLGATFALGWTPCIGPILGSILLLASVTATLGQGAVLLIMFSLGLALPFLITAAGVGSALRVISRWRHWLWAVNVIGGLFLILMGLLMLTDSVGLLVLYGYGLFDVIGYDRLLDYL